MENNYQSQYDQGSDMERLKAYFEGMLNPEQMHALEREALDDPFLQDALDGYSDSQGIHEFKISLLQKRLAERIMVKAEEKNTFFFSSARLAIASTAAVLFILAVVLFWMRNEIFSQRNRQKVVNVELAHQNWSISAGPADISNQTFKPTEGWSAIGEYLTEYQENVAFSARAVPNGHNIGNQSVHVLLKTDSAGKVISVQYLNQVDEEVQRTLKRLLQEGPTWQGRQGEALFSFKSGK